MIKRLVLPVLLAAGWGTAASAQVISIRTVPVSQAHQFDIYPSHTGGMGGISIAIDDSLLDPFTNPAKGTRLGLARLFSTPNAYTVTSGAGAGRGLPVGVLGRAGSWFGGVSAALQQVDMSEQTTFVIPPTCPLCRAQGIDVGPPEPSHGNSHLFAMLGTDLAPGLAIGGSLAWSGLHGIDGVDLLYANSTRIDQNGNAVDLRLGLLKEWENHRTFEALVVHNRFRMEHDVVYLDPFWDPGTQQTQQRPRVEVNLDRTTTWGLHTQYTIPLSEDGWRVGWLITANRMSHPKIPNYEIMNIPRDPGHSSAFNLGMGISKNKNGSTFGIDLVYEPIWSHTWADSDHPVETATGDTIPPGGMTIENNFDFSNALIRMGIDQELFATDRGSRIGIQVGLMVHSIDYRLEQQDHVQIAARRLDEHWVEWTPTWGLRFGFPELELRYRGSVTSGTGRPGVINNGGPLVLEGDATPNSNILVAPSGPLTLGDVTIVTHQISISLPLR